MNIPKNEIETIIWFAQKCRDYGFEIVSASSSSFPDAKLKELYSKSIISVEFEYLSSSFIEHEHDAHKCDMIICWIDDFPYKTKFPIWELSTNSHTVRGNAGWREADIINSYIRDFMNKRFDRRVKRPVSTDWRKVRPTLSTEQVKFIANSEPKEIVAYFSESGFVITPRNASNWKVYANKEASK